MSTILTKSTRLLVQGITGHQGTFNTGQMMDFGTKVVGGVTPGRSGETVLGLPVFDTMEEAVKITKANTSIVFVPAPFARDAVMEAIDSGIKTIVIITERIPVKDSIEFIQYARLRRARIIGPNCPGLASPGKAKVGIMPNSILSKGGIGVVSRSGTLTYEIVSALSETGLGQSTCIGIGGDPVIGTNFVEALALFEKDRETNAVVMIGEIGGIAEEEAAEFIERKMSKPVYAYIAGRTAPVGKRMGHAGAIIARGRGTAQSKISALEKAGARIATFPAEIPKIIIEEV
ncbi:MAG: succinate--CoA ligase subunit alpha [Methanomassiliicoccales archaeon]|jgi:succinyl-CoA synthetase alpha subunit|nr:succinate--CoA ligase subunit alpha [Methanomassiliicoccales archaeon]